MRHSFTVVLDLPDEDELTDARAEELESWLMDRVNSTNVSEATDVDYDGPID